MKTWELQFIARLTKKPLRLNDPDAMPVRRWRSRLRAKGWTSVAKTGPFDGKLLTATKAAQLAAGVSVDGVVGPKTWNGVGKLPNVAAPPKPPVVAKPKVLDCRDGRRGYPKHPTKNWGTRSIVQIRFICGHYTGNSVPFLNDAKFHVGSDYLDEGGAPAIAYTVGVEKNGDVLVFNDWFDITWHCDGGMNTATLGIVFLGGEEGPTDAQKRSLKYLVQAIREGTFKVGTEVWPKMDLPLTSHRHVRATSCPGTKGEAFYRTLGRFDSSPS